MRTVLVVVAVFCTIVTLFVIAVVSSSRAANLVFRLLADPDPQECEAVAAEWDSIPFFPLDSSNQVC